MMVLGFSEYEPQAQRLAQCLGVPYACVNTHYFPDRESRLDVAGFAAIAGHYLPQLECAER